MYVYCTSFSKVSGGYYIFIAVLSEDDSMKICMHTYIDCFTLQNTTYSFWYNNVSTIGATMATNGWDHQEDGENIPNTRG